MRRSLFALMIVAACAAVGVGLVAQRGGGQRIQQGQECPPGTTETRPGSCQVPEFPPPTIVDYRPRSTLVTAQHPVPKAKFPVVDIHGHAFGSLNSQEGLANIIKSLDALNVR